MSVLVHIQQPLEATSVLRRVLPLLQDKRDGLYRDHQVDGRVPEVHASVIDELVSLNEVIRDIQTVLWS